MDNNNQISLTSGAFFDRGNRKHGLQLRRAVVVADLQQVRVRHMNFVGCEQKPFFLFADGNVGGRPLNVHFAECNRFCRKKAQQLLNADSH